MFQNIPKKVVERMKALEETDARDRKDGTQQIDRLRQISPETGKLLAILLANAPEGNALEIGTSGGYSALWLSQATKLREEKLITFELLPAKANLAAETFEKAKVKSLVKLVRGDARGHMSDYDEVAFCFLDAEKEMYDEFYDLVIPNLVNGGLLVADNVISQKEDLGGLVEKAEADERVDAVVVPIGKGLLICRKV